MGYLTDKLKKIYGMKKSVLFLKIGKKISRTLKTIFRIEFRFLKNKKGKEIDKFSYQKEYIDFDIKEGDKVLDIGSGNYPFPLATHLADFYEEKTTHRAGPLIKDNRPFSNCSVEDTPFKDKEFDFVYCSHVLEHVENPGRACDEIMRIGKRGYIETPARTSDIMFNFTGIKNHHKWYVSFAGNTLVFIEWMEKDKRDTRVGYFFEQFHSKFKNPFQDLVCNNRDFFENMFLWKEKFNYYVFDKNGTLVSFRK